MDGHLNSMLRLGIVAVALATALGIFSGDRDMMNARVLGGAKLDFAIIDMEHAPWDADTLRLFVAAMKGTSGFAVAPLVRVATNGREIHHNQWMVKQALDAGAFGIVVPHVNTPEHARAAAVARRMPPTVIERLEER